MSFEPRPAQRRPDVVVLVWIAGIVLAAIAYVVGPDRLVAGALDGFVHFGAYLDALVHNFTLSTLQGLRAVAIGLYGTYVGLSLLAMRRGAQGPGGLIVVTIACLLLVWGADGADPVANARWAAALIIAALSALGATRRLTAPPRPPRA